MQKYCVLYTWKTNTHFSIRFYEVAVGYNIIKGKAFFVRHVTFFNRS